MVCAAISASVTGGCDVCRVVIQNWNGSERGTNWDVRRIFRILSREISDRSENKSTKLRQCPKKSIMCVSVLVEAATILKP